MILHYKQLLKFYLPFQQNILTLNILIFHYIRDIMRIEKVKKGHKILANVLYLSLKVNLYAIRVLHLHFLSNINDMALILVNFTMHKNS